MERYILALSEPNIDDAKDISVGDIVMEDYVNESVKVSEGKNFGESYDKEWALKDEWARVGLEQGRQEGLEQGIEQGIEIGKKESLIEVAKSMLDASIPISDITKYTGLSVSEIENLK